MLHLYSEAVNRLFAWNRQTRLVAAFFCTLAKYTGQAAVRGQTSFGGVSPTYGRDSGIK